MVEQATENRRVPSSNLGPGTFILLKDGDKLALRKGCFFVDLNNLLVRNRQKPHKSLGVSEGYIIGMELV